MRDEHSVRHASPPKAGSADDAALVAAAIADFKSLKKDLAGLFKRQKQRLEEAMVQRESFEASGMIASMFRHPVLGRLARRVVWATRVADGPPRCWVWADGAATTSDGALYEPSPGDTLSVVHPAEVEASEISALRGFLGTSRPLFEQLDRPVFTLEESERRLPVLERFAGVVPAQSLFSLEARGWVPMEGDSTIDGFARRLGDHSVTLMIDPGMPLAVRDLHPEQTVHAATVTHLPTGQPAALGDLGVVAASEVIRALTLLFG